MSKFIVNNSVHRLEKQSTTEILKERDKYNIFSISMYNTLTTHGNLLISNVNFEKHIDCIYRSKTRHILSKSLPTQKDAYNYVTSDNKYLVKARSLYIQYIKEITGFKEDIELIWYPGRKYKDESVSADCVIIQKVY